MDPASSLSVEAVTAAAEEARLSHQRWDCVEQRVRATTLAAEVERLGRVAAAAAERCDATQDRVSKLQSVIAAQEQQRQELVQGQAELQVKVKEAAGDMRRRDAELAALRRDVQERDQRLVAAASQRSSLEELVKELQARIAQLQKRYVQATGPALPGARRGADPSLALLSDAPTATPLLLLSANGFSGAVPSAAVDLAGQQAGSQVTILVGQIEAVTRQRDALTRQVKQLSKRLDRTAADSAAGGAHTAGIQVAAVRRTAGALQGRLAAAVRRIEQLKEQNEELQENLKQKGQYIAKLEETVLAQHKALAAARQASSASPVVSAKSDRQRDTSSRQRDTSSRQRDTYSPQRDASPVTSHLRKPLAPPRQRSNAVAAGVRSQADVAARQHDATATAAANADRGGTLSTAAPSQLGGAGRLGRYHDVAGPIAGAHHTAGRDPAPTAPSHDVYGTSYSRSAAPALPAWRAPFLRADEKFTTDGLAGAGYSDGLYSSRRWSPTQLGSFSRHPTHLPASGTVDGYDWGLPRTSPTAQHGAPWLKGELEGPSARVRHVTWDAPDAVHDAVSSHVSHLPPSPTGTYLPHKQAGHATSTWGDRSPVGRGQQQQVQLSPEAFDTSPAVRTLRVGMWHRAALAGHAAGLAWPAHDNPPDPPNDPLSTEPFLARRSPPAVGLQSSLQALELAVARCRADRWQQPVAEGATGDARAATGDLLPDGGVAQPATAHATGGYVWTGAAGRDVAGGTHTTCGRALTGATGEDDVAGSTPTLLSFNNTLSGAEGGSGPTSGALSDGSDDHRGARTGITAHEGVRSSGSSSSSSLSQDQRIDRGTSSSADSRWRRGDSRPPWSHPWDAERSHQRADGIDASSGAHPTHASSASEGAGGTAHAGSEDLGAALQPPSVRLPISQTASNDDSTTHAASSGTEGSRGSFSASRRVGVQPQSAIVPISQVATSCASSAQGTAGTGLNDPTTSFRSSSVLMPTPQDTSLTQQRLPGDKSSHHPALGHRMTAASPLQSPPSSATSAAAAAPGSTDNTCVLSGLSAILLRGVGTAAAPLQRDVATRHLAHLESAPASDARSVLGPSAAAGASSRQGTGGAEHEVAITHSTARAAADGLSAFGSISGSEDGDEAGRSEWPFPLASLPSSSGSTNPRRRGQPEQGAEGVAFHSQAAAGQNGAASSMTHHVAAAWQRGDEGPDMARPRLMRRPASYALSFSSSSSGSRGRQEDKETAGVRSCGGGEKMHAGVALRMSSSGTTTAMEDEEAGDEASYSVEGLILPSQLVVTRQQLLALMSSPRAANARRRLSRRQEDAA